MPEGGESGRVARRSFRRSGTFALLIAVLAATPARANTDVTISDAATTAGVSFAANTYTFGALTSANINTTELNTNLGSGSVTVNAVNGNPGSGTIAVNGPTPVIWSGAKSLNLTTSGPAGDVTINFPLQATGSANLTITTGGAITQSAPIQSGSFVTLNAGEPITLTHGTNDFAFVGANTGPFNVQIVDINAVSLLPIGTAGNLSVTAGGAISQNGGANALVDGTTTLNSNGNPITMGSGNDFFGPVSFSGSDVLLADTTALTVGLGTANNLTLLPGGTLSQVDATPANRLVVGGTTTVNAVGTQVNLSNPFNDFTGNVMVSPGVGASNATIADATALGLGTSQVNGSTTLTAPTSITAGSFTNDFQGAVSATTNGALTLRDDTDLALGTISSNGGDIFAGDALTQTGAISDGGLFEAQGDSVTLNNGANDFTQAGFESAAGPIEARDANSLTLVGVDATGGGAQVTAGNNLVLSSSLAPFTGATLTLVSDAAAGATVGPGGVTIPATRTLTATSAPIRIYSAKQGQNAIAAGALLNGSSFTPGSEFVDSAREVWGTAFPGGTASSPFTIFYKQANPNPPVAAPETTLTKTPKKKVKTKKGRAKVKFKFTADVAGASFECTLDDKADACTSPFSKKVKKGKHTFAVAASAAGKTDQTPASFSFKVKRKR